MKLIFQIAAGVILAVVIMYGTLYLYSNYQLKQVAEGLKLEQFKATQFLNQQRQALQLQQKKVKEQTLQQQKMRNERAIRQQKINEAWTRYYKEPYNCQHASSQKEFTWCGNYKAGEKRKFLDLLSQGKIIVG